MSSNVRTLGQKLKDDDLTFSRSQFLGPNIECKLDELKSEMVQKIEKELADSQNARAFISQKYDELCSKISFLTELDATVTGFRSDVKTIEKQISELATRVDDIERKTIFKDHPSLASSLMPPPVENRPPCPFYEVTDINDIPTRDRPM